MMQLLTIGYPIPGFSEEFVDFGQNRSILDADLVLIEPDLSGFAFAQDYQGTPLMSPAASARYLQAMRHWRSELDAVLQHGRTVFCFFSEHREFYVYSGDQELSGTGRSQKRINLVRNATTFDFLPVPHPPIVSRAGASIRFTGDSRFSTYWKEFGSYSCYESYFDGHVNTPLFVTRTADRPVGALFKHGKGHLVLLPPVRYPENEFLTKDQKRWKQIGLSWGRRFVESLAAIADVLERRSQQTPPPPWAIGEVFRLADEVAIETKLVSLNKKRLRLDRDESALTEELGEARVLKGLLYEKGPALEGAVLRALRILGFNAERYDDGKLELDGILVSPEGMRCICEVEGRDQAAINIDKFRQLLGNIQEDFQREEITEPARGILFGNGYRLLPPNERQQQFTEKCQRNAAINAIALVPTTALFHVAKYVLESGDQVFAKQCRDILATSTGMVTHFPPCPKEKDIG